MNIILFGPPGAGGIRPKNWLISMEFRTSTGTPWGNVREGTELGLAARPIWTKESVFLTMCLRIIKNRLKEQDCSIRFHS